MSAQVFFALPKAFLIAVIAAVSSTALAFDHQHIQLDALLQQHVQWNEARTNTAVDYSALQSDASALEDYLKSLSAVSAEEFNDWSNDQQLAFLINAYNAFTLQLILEHYPVDSIRDIVSFWKSPWKIRFFTLLGNKMHLDHLEHQLIRDWDEYGEPRIHFAVNCASIGCPALRTEAYTASKLEEQLEDQTQRFLADSSRNRFEDGVLKLSPIFKWYREDFEKNWRGGRSLSEFLLRYKHALSIEDVEQIQIQFLDYDWQLNGAQQ